MPKVTQVEPQKNNPHRFNIYLDGKFGFGADEDLVVSFRLVVGKEIISADLENLLFEAEVGKLVERIYRLLNIRLRSEKEIRDYLKQLSFKNKLKDKEPVSEMATESLIEKLKKRELINDLEFAKTWVAARRKSKLKGIQAIKSELYQKGIDRQIIEEVFSTDVSTHDEETLAINAIQKKLRLWKSLDNFSLKRKCLEFLVRRGFSYDLAKDVVEKVTKKEYTDSL